MLVFLDLVQFCEKKAVFGLVQATLRLEGLRNLWNFETLGTLRTMRTLRLGGL